MRKQPTFGELFGLYGVGESPAYINEVGDQVWMYRQSQKIRFFDRAANQVGPEHANVVPATVWAFAHGWINQNGPAWLNDARRDQAARV